MGDGRDISGFVASRVPDYEPMAYATPIPVRHSTCDPHAFAALYMRHRPSFVGLASRYLNDRRDQDEVVQEAFLRLFLALPELESDLQVLAYSRRTITNLCIDRMRADQRRPRLLDLSADVVEELADDEQPDPVTAAEDAAVVREALSLLSPLHREALVKREIEEKPLPQIAEELDIPVESVKHVLHRARRALRRLLVGTSVEPGAVLEGDVLDPRRSMPVPRRALSVIVLLIAVIFGADSLRTVLTGNEAPELAADVPTDAPVVSGREPVREPVPGAPRAQTPSVLPVPVLPPGRISPSAPQAEVTVEPVVPVVPSGGASAPGSPQAPAGPVAPPVLPEQEQQVVVEGLRDAGTAYVRSQSKVARAEGASESTSDIAVDTPGPDYELTQAFTFAATGELVDVKLSELVPTDRGVVATDVVGTTASSETRQDGSVLVTVSGTRQIAEPATDEGEAQASSAPLVPVAELERSAVSVQVLLDSDRLLVLKQRIVLVPEPPVTGPDAPQGETTPARPELVSPGTLDGKPSSRAPRGVSDAPDGEAPAASERQNDLKTGEEDLLGPLTKILSSSGTT